MLLNILIFNWAWFTLILRQNDFLLLILLLFSIQFFYTSNKTTESKILITITLLGISVDSLLMQSGVLNFTTQDNLFIPLWLMLIWLGFATTVNKSLLFLTNKPRLQFLIGATLPPLNYLAGESFGAVSFSYSNLTTFIILSLIWAPLLIFIFHCQAMFTNKIDLKGEHYD